MLVNLVHRAAGADGRQGQPEGDPAVCRTSPGPTSTMVNRQRGAGTRVLLDLRLRQLGIVPEQVRGLRPRGGDPHRRGRGGGQRRCGRGTRHRVGRPGPGSGFRTAGAGEIRPGDSRVHGTSRLRCPLLATLRSESFKAVAREMGGYDTSDTGKVMARTGPSQPSGPTNSLGRVAGRQLRRLRSGPSEVRQESDIKERELKSSLALLAILALAGGRVRRRGGAARRHHGPSSTKAPAAADVGATAPTARRPPKPPRRRRQPRLRPCPDGGGRGQTGQPGADPGHHHQHPGQRPAGRADPDVREADRLQGQDHRRRLRPGHDHGAEGRGGRAAGPRPGLGEDSSWPTATASTACW